MKSLSLEHRALSTWTFSLRVWKDWICLENCYTIEIYLHKVQLVYSLHCIHKWRCHTNMSVIETISHSMHFPWRVCASHFISFTCFPKPENVRIVAEKCLHSEFFTSLQHLNIRFCSSLKSLCIFTSCLQQFPIHNDTSLKNYILCVHFPVPSLSKHCFVLSTVLDTRIQCWTRQIKFLVSWSSYDQEY